MVTGSSFSIFQAGFGCSAFLALLFSVTCFFILTCFHSLTFCVLHPVVYPVENFTISSSSETTLSFSWTQSRIVADNLTGYILKCSSLLEGIPSPDPIMIAPTATTANVTELFSGVTYSCEIITLTSEGRSQPRSLNSTTVETG